jgi:Helix-turn-helix domain
MDIPSDAEKAKAVREAILPKPADQTELLTAGEVAQLLRCSVRTLDRERANGVGCQFVRIGRRILYRRADIETFVAANVRGHATGAVPAPSRRRRLSKQVAHVPAEQVADG